MSGAGTSAVRSSAGRTGWTLPRVGVGVAWGFWAGVQPTQLLVVPEAVRDIGALVVLTLCSSVPLVLGTLVAARSPRHPAGPLLAAAGAVLPAANVPAEAAPVLAGTWMLLYLPFAIVLLLVPDGRAGSPRWKAVGWALTVVVAGFIAGCAALALRPQWESVLNPIGYTLLAAFLALLVCCAAAPIVRYRQSSDADRLRLRWVLLAGAALPLTLLLCWASYLVLGVPDLVGLGLALSYLLIPAGIAAAILRPNLFDIDRATVATATAAALTAMVLAVLSVASGLAGLTLLNWSPIAAIGTVAALTLAAVAAAPRVRWAFDRLLYPDRARALTALDALQRRVDAGSAEPEELQQVLREALRDAGLVVAYLSPGTDHLIGLDGRAVAGAGGVPVVVRHERIGLLVPSADRATRPAASVVRAVAPLLDAVRVRAELAHSRVQVEESRQRVLQAGYAERRRLERDLHDGAQQRLVALGMRLRVLQRGPAAGLTDELDAAVAEVATAVAELRRLAHGMRPSALDDGLAPALADLTRLAPEMLELDVQAPELPDPVATTAYYVVSEAVTNALRHAGAERIRVTVRQAGDELRVRIDDDGEGGAAPAGTGGGLVGLADRVAATGGRLRIDSPPGRGTTVEAVLPCGS